MGLTMGLKVPFWTPAACGLVTGHCIVLPVLNKELLNSKTNLFPRALNEGFPDLFRKEMLYNI